MEISVNGQHLYVDSGGRACDPGLPSVVFVHGVLNDHSVWRAQTTGFAQHGWNALAMDLPGHARSTGRPPATVEDAADTLLALLDALGIKRAALVGHSFGSLIALQAAARAPERVSHLALVGTAFPMHVAPSLLRGALTSPAEAMHMVNVYSHNAATAGAPRPGPGQPLYDALAATMERVLASNRKFNLLHAGLQACDGYTAGNAAMEAVRCPTLFLLGRGDRMTPPRSARTLATHARDARVVEIDAGHAMLLEAPGAVLSVLQEFLGAA